VSGVVGHPQALGDPLENIQPGHLASAIDDLVHSALRHVHRGGDPRLAHPGVLLE
jgi:hypothetical protein